MQGGEKRKDDTVEVTTQRLAIYHRESNPLLDYYQQAGRLMVTVTEKPSADAVYREVMSAYLKQREAEQRKAAPALLR
jgi:adenylate kinase family enzyme